MLDRADIRSAHRAGNIAITPWDDDSLRVNSYDLHLHPSVVLYTRRGGERLDCAKDNPTTTQEIPEDGYDLLPGTLYLLSTIEYTETRGFVPWLDGKSSLGRLGLFVHVTAGRGDDGFCGHWTMEAVVVEPLRVYAGMPVAQVSFFETGSSPKFPRPPVAPYTYKDIAGSKYAQQGAQPVPSRMHRNFPLPDRWVQAARALRTR